jgi:hypothetical protein
LLFYHTHTHTQVDKDYTVPLNFRMRVNPLVIVVFEQPTGRLRSTFTHANSIDTDGLFNLQTLMLDNGLAGRMLFIIYVTQTCSHAYRHDWTNVGACWH